MSTTQTEAQRLAGKGLKWNSFGTGTSQVGAAADAEGIGLQHVITSTTQAPSSFTQRRRLNVALCGIQFAVAAGAGPMDSGALESLLSAGKLCGACLQAVADIDAGAKGYPGVTS